MLQLYHSELYQEVKELTRQSYCIIQKYEIKYYRFGHIFISKLCFQPLQKASSSSEEELEDILLFQEG